MKLSMATQILGFQHNVLLKKLKKKKRKVEQSISETVPVSETLL
jgi:hypothetical protein